MHITPTFTQSTPTPKNFLSQICFSASMSIVFRSQNYAMPFHKVTAGLSSLPLRQSDAKLPLSPSPAGLWPVLGAHSRVPAAEELLSDRCEERPATAPGRTQPAPGSPATDPLQDTAQPTCKAGSNSVKEYLRKYINHPQVKSVLPVTVPVFILTHKLFPLLSSPSQAKERE